MCVTTGSAASTIDRIHHTRRRDGELAIPIRHEGRVLEDRLLAAAARSFQKDLRVRVVGHDGPPTTLDRGRAEGELVGDRHDLVRHDDGDAEGLGDLLELGQVAVQRLLALGQVASPLVLRAEVPGLFSNTEAILPPGASILF